MCPHYGGGSRESRGKEDTGGLNKHLEHLHVQVLEGGVFLKIQETTVQ